MSSSHFWIATETELQHLCSQWQNLPEIALDTEFIRTSTFYPLPALLQINDGSKVYLLDVLSLGKPECLLNLMVSGPAKILHSCSEDLEMLHHWLGVLPYPLIDTQLAVGLISGDSSIGYQRMVENYLQISLDKGEARSNWLQRPLTPAQQIYAAQDVEYLLPVWQLLKQQLAAVNKLEILYAESNWLLDETLEDYPEDAWQRCKMAWRLPARELAVLQNLAKWREDVAQQLNKPRNHIIKEAQLQILAERLPHSLDDLTRLGEFSPGWIKNFGTQALKALHQAMQLPEQLLPTPLTSPRDTSYKNARQQLQTGLAELATNLDVPVEMLARRKQINEWMQALAQRQLPDVPENWPQWRRQPLEQLLRRLWQQSLTSSATITTT